MIKIAGLCRLQGFHHVRDITDVDHDAVDLVSFIAKWLVSDVQETFSLRHLAFPVPAPRTVLRFLINSELFTDLHD
jgi:hypothetical protein